MGSKTLYLDVREDAITCQDVRVGTVVSDPGGLTRYLLRNGTLFATVYERETPCPHCGRGRFVSAIDRAEATHERMHSAQEHVLDALETRLRSFASVIGLDDPGRVLRADDVRVILEAAAPQAAGAAP